MDSREVSHNGNDSREYRRKRCYTVKEVQEMLGISRPTVYELLKKMNSAGSRLETNTVFQRRVLTNGWIRSPKLYNLPSK